MSRTSSQEHKKRLPTIILKLMESYQLIKTDKVKMNPNNPRVVKDDKFQKLVKSIKEFPEMLKLRPIVVNDDMVVLGGNMRLKAYTVS